MTTTKRTFRMFIEEELGEFPHFLVWAVLEWMLIISLYLDGFLSCIANKFADVFELDPPCVLCTRVDHALGGKNPNLYYNESICESHKKDISSLAYCHVHRKLSDIRNMCDGCLLSFATDKDADSDSNKLKDDDEGGKAEDDQKKTSAELAEKKVKDSSKTEVGDENRCSCCGECLKPKQVTKEASKEVSRCLSNFRAPSLLSSNSPRTSSSLFPNSSPRAFSSSLFPSLSPRASSLFPNSSPRAFSSSLFPNSSPRASSLFPNSSPRASSLFPNSSPRASSLFPNSSPRASSLFPSLSPRASSLFPSLSPRASSLFPNSSPRASSLFPNSSPRASSLFPSTSLPPMASPRSWRIEEGRNSEMSHPRYSDLKFVSDNEPDMPEDYYGLNVNTKQTKDTKSGQDSEDPNEDSGKTPGYNKGNKFFGIPLTESITGSPRWAASKPPKKAPIDKPDLFSDAVEEPPSADGQTLVQQLKKQISDNRKTLVTLFMELDEERSAAAVAANNAMAMITRLQAEKAGVHMEALQYQRMMDEQAEYDEEAIQILRDLFFKKEEDVKVLEDELEMYRVRYGELKKFGSDEYDFDADEYYDELQARTYGEKSEGGSLVDGGGNRKGNHEASVNFETERNQLFGMLKDFEDYHARLSSQEDRHDKHTGKGSNVKLLREVSLLMEKLTAMEAESGFLKQAAMTLEKGDEGTKVVSEIAEHLRKIPSPQKSDNTNTINA
ncbi:hypothetical protein L6452_34397 [Arctium lappa]|uniref:Uncharacterized protein n=1 Tax=Arctium lappa TaxID=4217 RepID=A0ACB8YI75_ARCLA|nr:hypothetical protein L6452_34397 [Arctium lappa]